MTKEATSKELPIFIKWMDFLKWLLVITDNFPKKARFTFVDRMTNLSFEIVEDLVEARYSKNKSYSLKRINMNIEKLRIFIRICYECRFLSKKSYEHAAYSINEIGKMLGGWIKQQGAYETTRTSL